METPDIGDRTSAQLTFFRFSFYEVRHSMGLRYIAPLSLTMKIGIPSTQIDEKQSVTTRTQSIPNEHTRIYAGLPCICILYCPFERIYAAQRVLKSGFGGETVMVRKNLDPERSKTSGDATYRPTSGHCRPQSAHTSELMTARRLFFLPSNAALQPALSGTMPTT